MDPIERYLYAARLLTEADRESEAAAQCVSESEDMAKWQRRFLLACPARKVHADYRKVLEAWNGIPLALRASLPEPAKRSLT